MAWRIPHELFCEALHAIPQHLLFHYLQAPSAECVNQSTTVPSGGWPSCLKDWDPALSALPHQHLL